ncbi:MAG: hypothetical protein IKJ44_00830 [Elusimicrobiaceae bacterium]|nr:hypothetical protein [Elusimicrobiaceae bacterium]
MPNFSKISRERLNTCHPDIVRVCEELIKQYDFSVLQGYRGEKEQNKAFERGNSNVRWPRSAHNKTPSWAVDIAPYPIDWENLARFREMIYRFDALACLLRERGEIKSHFVYGAFWKNLKDFPHIEIKGE